MPKTLNDPQTTLEKDPIMLEAERLTGHPLDEETLLAMSDDAFEDDPSLKSLQDYYRNKRAGRFDHLQAILNQSAG